MPPVSPIKHVVILSKENHGFDNYFGPFPAQTAPPWCTRQIRPARPQAHAQRRLNRATGAVRQQLVESDIPTYFAQARQFTLCENYFTDVLVALHSESPDGHHRGFSMPMEILCMTFLLCLPVSTPPDLRGAIMAGYISKTLHSHVSLVKFCETIFGLKTLNGARCCGRFLPRERLANASGLILLADDICKAASAGPHGERSVLCACSQRLLKVVPRI